MENEPILGENNQLVLISGHSATGKSAALRNIRNQERWLYLNTEAGKRLPFQNSFQSFRIEDPYQVIEAFEHGTDNPDIDGIALDSITFMMDMLETQYVLTATDTQKAWGEFAQFFKRLMQQKVVAFGKPVVMLAHTLDILDENTHQMTSKVPIKGALKNNGVEAYFSTVVSTKKIPLKDLKDADSNLIQITEDEEDLGFKYVFQTRPTKQTLGERMRSPMGMFSRNQTYMDNDAQLLLDHLEKYYNG